MEKDMHLNPGTVMAKPDAEDGPKTYAVDNGSQSGSTLVPMLIAGIILIVIGMIAVMAFS
jgi:hypothetical protein